MSDNTPKHAEETVTTSTGLVLSSAWYNRLKWLVLIFIPAFSTLYAGLSVVIPGLPGATQVVGVLALLAVFLGIVLGISSQNFAKQGADGSINAQIQGDQVILSKLAMPNIAPEELAGKKSVTIQVNPTSNVSQ